VRVGDLVSWRGTTAVVVNTYHRAEQDGNPNGDFEMVAVYVLRVGDRLITTRRKLPVLNRA